jgi:hypothetical protein
MHIKEKLIHVLIRKPCIEKEIINPHGSKSSVIQGFKIKGNRDEKEL